MKLIFEPKTDPAPTPNNRSRLHSVNTEFCEARQWLLPDSTNVPALDKAARTVRNRDNQRRFVAASSELVEEAFYWFLTAPALVYVVYLAFGL
jgi:hypothetical protein